MSVFTSLLSIKSREGGSMGMANSPSFSDFSLGCASAVAEEDQRSRSMQEDRKHPSLHSRSLLQTSLTPHESRSFLASPSISPTSSLQMSPSLNSPTSIGDASKSSPQDLAKPWRRDGLDMYDYRGLASDMYKSP